MEHPIDTLEVPIPPYRMPRIVATLTSDGPPSMDEVLDTTVTERTKEQTTAANKEPAAVEKAAEEPVLEAEPLPETVTEADTVLQGEVTETSDLASKLPENDPLKIEAGELLAQSVETAPAPVPAPAPAPAPEQPAPAPAPTSETSPAEPEPAPRSYTSEEIAAGKHLEPEMTPEGQAGIDKLKAGGPSQYEPGRGVGWYDREKGIFVPDTSPEAREKAKTALEEAEAKLRADVNVDNLRARDAARKAYETTTPAPAEEHEAATPVTPGLATESAPEPEKKTEEPITTPAVVEAKPSASPEREPMTDDAAVEAVRENNLDAAREWYAQQERNADQDPSPNGRTRLTMRWAELQAKGGRADLAEQTLRDAYMDSFQRGDDSLADEVRSKLQALETTTRKEQEGRGTEMAAEADERLKQESLEKIPPKDRLTLFGALSEAGRYIFERSGARPWLDTIVLRLKARGALFDAQTDALFQARAQGKLDLAEEKVRDYQEKMRDAGMLSKLWYGNRLRSWQARAAKMEAKVDDWNASRERFVEKHNDFRREIAERYNRELEPYKDLVRDFVGRLEAQQKARDILADHRAEALQKLAEAEAAGKKGRWFMGPRARRAVNEIRKQLEDIDKRIARVDGVSRGYRNTLAGAQANVDKWELKMRAVAQSMQLPEFAELKRPRRGPEVPLPAARPLETTVAPKPARTETVPAQPAGAEKDPKAAQWKLDDFIEQWNANGLQPIEDPKAFTEYVAAERRRLNQPGDPTGAQATELLGPYLSRASAVKMDKNQLKRDVEFFFSHAKPKK